MGGEITLQQALERVDSTSVKERAEGLSDLKHILRNNSKFESLSDDAFHWMYETLFRAAITEQSAYSKAKTPTTRKGAESRLSTCASALRSAVDAGVRLVRSKTARAILDHVIQTLCLPTGGFCEPIALDYAKCLRAVLSHQPHVEHLSRKERERSTSFCVQCIDKAESDLNEDDAAAGAETGFTMSYRSSRSLLNESGGSQGSRSFAKQIMEEMVACLYLLTNAPNPTSAGQSDELLQGLMRFLRNNTDAIRSHRDAYAAVNNLLSWTRTEDIKVTTKALGPLIRLIRNYWTLKSTPALKDEILITCLLLRPYIISAIQQKEDQALRSDLTSLLNTMKSEYSKLDATTNDYIKQADYQLQMDELRLSINDMANNRMGHIRTVVFALRCLRTRAEANWAVVHMLAALCIALSDSIDDDLSSSDEDDDIDRRPRKRQRLTNEFEETLKIPAGAPVSSRVCALQTIAFLAQQKRVSCKQLEKVIDALCSVCIEDNAVTSSWALLSLASIASQGTAGGTTLSARWLSVWQLATRAMSNGSTCRSACHLLHLMLSLRLVPQQNILDLVQTITTSIDLGGPSLLADSVAQLLSAVVKTAQQHNPASSSATAESVLNWLFRNFQPSRFDERACASQYNLFESADVIQVITTCLGDTSGWLNAYQVPTWEAIGQTWLSCEEQQDVVAYLLLLPDTEMKRHGDHLPPAQAASSTANHKASGEAIVLNHLINELFRAHETWNGMIRERPRSINSDIFTSLCKICVISSHVAYCSPFRDLRRQSQLQRQARDIATSLGRFISSPNCSQDRVDSMLAIFSSECSGLLGSADVDGSGSELLLCQTLATALKTRETNKDFNGVEDDEDEMDIDETYDSQDSRHRSHSAMVQNFKNYNSMRFSNFTLRASVTLYASIVTAQSDGADTGEGNNPSAAVIEHILSLPERSMLSAHTVISGLSRIGVVLTASDSYQLLDVCAEKILEAYQFERSEVATAAVLDIMLSLAPVWTDKSDDELFKLGIDMYEWYTRIALAGGVLSPKVQKSVAALLLQLCQIDTDYGRDSDVSSVRTSLFELLHQGSVSVQFYLAFRISTIFDLFVLSNHLAMFEDLQASLPTHSESVEGMALRLLFLAKLASAWHSLLRPCVYYIFETAGRVEISADYARRTITQLAVSLGFKSPKQLFKLFAPQLLFNWLESNTVNDLPFDVFGFESLDALVVENVAELTAQLLVKGDDEGMHVVISTMRMSSTEMILLSFARCAAYCLAADVSTLAGKKGEPTSESRLRNLIESKEEYKNLLTSQFPTIVGYFFLTLEQEDVHDKWTEKKPNYGIAWKALNEIKSLGQSDRSLPPCQQPSLKSRYFCDELERLCRRSGHDPTKPWDASSFALTARMLLDSLSDALGPLHNCLTIRRLRLLISTAGDAAFSGLPLEMLIYTLRPFLSDSQCADDVIGVLQYLFRHGKGYLKDNLPFLFGTVTLMALQIQKHSGARQESTTQESQHQATVLKMQQLKSWLVKYLEECQVSNGSAVSRSYKKATEALARVNLPGNARKDSAESVVLLFLLSQHDVNQALMRKQDRDEALTLLSESFEIPSMAAEDCLGRDVECARFAPKLWSALRIKTLTKPFVTWVAGVLGRSYASTGERPWTDATGSASGDAPSLEVYSKSQALIAGRLHEDLFSRSHTEAGLADFTLRSIMMSFGSSEQALEFEQMVPSQISSAIVGGTYGYDPPGRALDSIASNAAPLQQLLDPSLETDLEEWAQSLGCALCANSRELAILPALTPALKSNPILAIDLLPSIIHILLTAELENGPHLRSELSAGVTKHLSHTAVAFHPKQKFFLKLLLYLRRQPLPKERTHADRLHWLDVNWQEASETAMRCQLPACALMFAESSAPETRSRRSSTRASLSQISASQVSQEVLLTIFKQLEEPDSFYGVDQPASLDSVLSRLDYEGDGFKSLMLRSAQNDTQLRHSHQLSPSDKTGIIHSLSMLNLNSVTFALLSRGFGGVHSNEQLLNAACRLQQWDIIPPSASQGASASCFAAFQELSRAKEPSDIESRLHSILLSHVEPMAVSEQISKPPYEWFSTLASLVEMSEVVGSLSSDNVQSTWTTLNSRQSWMRMAPFEHFRTILSNRESCFSVVMDNKALAAAVHADYKQCREIQLESLLQMSKLSRDHGQLQEALAAVSIVNNSMEHGGGESLKLHSAAKLETALVLWESSEPTASVKMLRDALSTPNIDSKDASVGRPGLLAQLAHQLAEARLERPDDILTNYLKPAINHLSNHNEGEEAGDVFYEFASFCDQQLQNHEHVEELNRTFKLRQMKSEEVEELERVGKSLRRSGSENKEHTRSLSTAKKWYEIYNTEHKRLRRSEEIFMQQSLQNYMLALRASDEHDISVLRFFALWLENADSPEASKLVAKYLPCVPSWKFVVLMNQLMSRLVNDQSPFQSSLRALALRICNDHPHHSLHHLFASTRKPSSEEEAAMSRYEAAEDIRQRLDKEGRLSELLKGMFRADSGYDVLANQDYTKYRSSSRLAVKDVPAAYNLAKTLPSCKVPPATLSLTLRPDGVYSDVPILTKFSSTMSLMSGISRPKKLTVYASDGKQYTQLFKSGDDLRQDAIMEQVFGEVSKMLRNHKATRQRNLHVRTYKVIPLSSSSGIIEFVANTTSLGDFLIPAHERYHPQDIKNHAAREKIEAAKNQSTEVKVKEFRKVCDHLHPVLRHFFLEKFKDPDEWFEKRTAYTRTTATISMLGYVLGLGDRHCQNIMLDEKTGEIVHIDLGVAFEAGRVLPVPEMVPFRLTRDVIDGMGITKTEGVFRRCCEFSMDALREDKTSIMTLLNVLRYDPLYSWTVSPIRAKRIQEESERNARDIQGADGSSKKKEQDAGEADRALSIVEKKLSKTLSTAATVNELIQQATDERNVATLFYGWSAWF